MRPGHHYCLRRFAVVYIEIYDCTWCEKSDFAASKPFFERNFEDFDVFRELIIDGGRLLLVAHSG